MPTQELQDLFEKLVKDKMSSQEIRRMEVLLHDKENAHTAQDLIASFFEKADNDDILLADRKILFEDFMKQALKKESSLESAPVLIHHVHFIRRWGWAAASVIILAAGAYLFTTTKNNNQTLVSENKQLKVDMAPGRDRAILTLADGRTIALDSASNGQLARQGNAQVMKVANGEIAYHVKGLSAKEVMWNTMSTPAGGQYHITLPDGTKVWLNAASSIRYPAVFAGRERNVKITGEVYLEVAKNKQKPFLVDVDGKSTIQVLGTSFNINSYADENAIRTTLIDGSVRILLNNAAAVDASANRQPKNIKSSVTLQPGQQASIIDNSSGIIVTPNADISQALAWKNGLFSFNNADLKSVLRQLERWYDIKVQYVGVVSDIPVKGKMYRNVNLSTILEFLKESGIKFKMEGKTLIVL